MNLPGTRRAAAAALLACLWCGPAWGAEITAAQAVDALKRHVCFSRTWWGDPYARLGQTATADIRIDGRNAYAWSEDMRAVPRVRRWADSYAVAARAGGAVVTERSGYNIELLRGEPAFERERRRVYGGPTQRVRIELPASCEPQFDPDTPLKVEMREAVIRSLSAAVSTWGRRPPRGGAAGDDRRLQCGLSGNIRAATRYGRDTSHRSAVGRWRPAVCGDPCPARPRGGATPEADPAAWTRAGSPGALGLTRPGRAGDSASSAASRPTEGDRRHVSRTLQMQEPAA